MIALSPRLNATYALVSIAIGRTLLPERRVDFRKRCDAMLELVRLA
ncbi:MAG: hypothetical protein IPH76_17555 [Xanthomonadales bacterium]|nr:hypothetical protein [Xanthomonadales bacterium]